LHRDIRDAGLELIKQFEGLFLSAYKCPAGVWTIGWGHTGLKHKDGTVYPGRTISKAEAEKLLRHDLDVFEGRVLSFITVPLKDHEFSALVSFDFNTGGLGDSTLRRKLNAGDRAGAAAEFPRWNKVAGKTLAGLTRRREAERKMFLGIA
jgi:lysozyme